MKAGSEGPSRSGRSDARANRGKILDAARRALKSPIPLSMQAVAREAGVGQGTLYRHFPTREDLILAVHRNDVDDLVDRAATLLEEATPPDALHTWLHLLGEYGRLKHGLASVLDTESRSNLAAEHEGPVTKAASLLVEACQGAGWMRTDIQGSDILQLVGFLWRLPPTPETEVTVSRLIDVVLNGLRIS